MYQDLIKYSISPYWDTQYKKTLQAARDTYGNSAQILVSNEELCELAAVCAKFPRYDSAEKARAELHDKAIDEVADVMIVLDHVVNIFGLRNTEILSRIDSKIERLSRWLKASDSMEQTTVDREVKSKPPCGNCVNYGDFNNAKPGGICTHCVQDENYPEFVKTKGDMPHAKNVPGKV